MRVAKLPLMLLAGALLWSPAVRAGGHDNDYEHAVELHFAGHYDQAAAGFIAAYRAGRREPVAAYNAACALARLGRTDEAFEWLGRAAEAGFDLDGYLQRDDDLTSLRRDPRWAALRASVRPEARASRDAERLARRYDQLRSAPDADAHHFGELAREMYNAGSYDDASHAYVRAAMRDDDPATSLYNAACSRALGGQTEAALDLLERAIEEGFTSARHMDRDDDLDSLRGEPRFEKLRALARTLDTPPYLGEQAARKGRVLEEWRAKLPEIEAATRAHPDLGYVWFNLGFAYIIVGQPARAVAPFQHAIQRNYRVQTSMYDLACAHALAGHVDEAIQWLEQAIGQGFDSVERLQKDADLDNVRNDPRFRGLVEMARRAEND